MYTLPKIEELLEAGVHFGHQVRRGHPRMKPYIYGAKEGIHIIDLTQSEKYLKEAAEFVYELGQNNKVMVFVGTKKQARPIIEEAAKKLDAPFLVERWMGGFLTNFEQMQKNIKILKEFKEAKIKGTLKKYTKKEQLLLERKMEKLDKDFRGAMDLSVLPDAVFVVDAVSDNIAVKEANRLGIKVVAIADSNCDPTTIEYPIPGNDDAIKSIKILVDTIADAYGEGKKSHSAEATRDKEAADKKAVADAELDETLKVEVAAAEEMVEKKAVKDSEKVV